MARLQIVPLGLLLLISFAVLASAAGKGAPASTPEAAPTTSGGSSAASSPVDDNAIGTTDEPSTGGNEAAPSPEGDVAVAGPAGSPSTYENYPPAAGPSGASTLGISAAGSLVLFSLSFFLH